MQTERHADPSLSQRARGRQRTSGASRELTFWYYMRLSGLALLFLALVHFAATHITTDVVDTDFNFVQSRWQNPLWRVFDWALLALGLSHGVLGVRTIIDDYVVSSRGRAGYKALLFFVVGGLFLLGSIIIFTFDATGPAH